MDENCPPSRHQALAFARRNQALVLAGDWRYRLSVQAGVIVLCAVVLCAVVLCAVVLCVGVASLI